ncbi:hypothetical protein Syun_011751 [Stephania yunnanensis]|uniref:Uncharacterized protein n=1 Tax=Stephania yunnanensis TaxID=152371 RepID=A0AAP0JYC3_9MAGN
MILLDLLSEMLFMCPASFSLKMSSINSTSHSLVKGIIRCETSRLSNPWTDTDEGIKLLSAFNHGSLLMFMPAPYHILQRHHLSSSNIEAEILLQV